MNAPVAVVELGDDTPSRPAPANDNSDLVRSSVESLTRTMEAMQRAQVERERTLAQKERSFADAQVARDRMFTDLLIALLDRSTNGKPQDPLSVLRQQLAFQKALDNDAGRRNAAVVVPEPVEEEPAEEGDKMPKWLAGALPFMPMVATGIQEFVVHSVAKGDPTKAERLRGPTKEGYRWDGEFIVDLEGICSDPENGRPAERPPLETLDPAGSPQRDSQFSQGEMVAGARRAVLLRPSGSSARFPGSSATAGVTLLDATLLQEFSDETAHISVLLRRHHLESARLPDR